MAEGLPDLVSHVKLDTKGVDAGAAEAITKVKALGKAIDEQAAANVAARVKETAQLRGLAAQYEKMAATAVKGSAEQAAAAKLAADAQAKLSSSVGAGASKAKAEIAQLGTATKGIEQDFKGLLTSLTGVGGGTSQLSSVFSTFSGSVGKARSAMGGVSAEGNMLKTVMTGAAAGVAGVGLALGALAVEGLGKFTAAAGQVRGLAATLGASAQDASKLRNVAIGLGVDVDTMGKAFFKLGPILEKSQGDIAGVHVELARTKTGGLDYIGTLDNLRSAYQQLTDPAQKAAFALELFKKTGQELRPILSATNEQFQQMAKTGPIFKDSDLKAAKDLGIAQRELKQAVDSAEISLAKGLVPIITQATTAANNGVTGLTNFATALSRIKSEGGPAGTAVGLLEKGLGLVAKNVTPLGPLLDVLNSGHKKSQGSAQAQADAESKLATELAETAQKAKDAAAAFDKLVTAQESALDKDIAMDHALRTAVQSADGVTKAQLALAQAHQTVTEKQEALSKAQKDGESTASDIRGATLDLESAQLAEKEAVQGVTEAQNAQRDALIDAAKSVRDKQVADREASGEVVTAEGKLRLFIGALRDQAGTLAPDSPLRTNLNEYADKLENGIPREVNTTLNADTSAAMAKLAEYNAAIDRIESRHASAPVSSEGDYTYSPPEPGAASYSENERPPDEPNARGNRIGARSVIPLAGGGRTNGFRTNLPRFLVGEGDRRYPETVIASDPRFRERNLRLLSMAASDLGVRGGDGPAIDYGALAAALAPVLAAAVAENPIRAYVPASELSRGLTKARPR